MANFAQTTASASDDHHLTRGLQIFIFGVDCRVHIAIHALGKLEGSSEFIRIDWTVCHFGVEKMMRNRLIV